MDKEGIKRQQYKKINHHIWAQTHKKDLFLYRQKIKNEVFSYYSKKIPCCAKCGISDIRVLSLDHIDGGGCKMRKSLDNHGGGGFNFYIWLRKNNYPKNINLQVLCMNCQFIKRFEQHENTDFIHGGKKID